jgi:hypothetical protein
MTGSEERSAKSSRLDVEGFDTDGGNLFAEGFREAWICWIEIFYRFLG